SPFLCRRRAQELAAHGRLCVLRCMQCEQRGTRSLLWVRHRERRWLPMRISIGLPGTIPGVQGSLLVDWARRAEAGPFARLGALDRLVYPTYEPLIMRTAAAAVSQRIRLMTTVLLAPLRNTAVLAKQTASLDALSGGRLTLGLGIGGREDDFQVAEQDLHTRGRRFEEQLEALHRSWSGQPLRDGIGAIGPAPVQAGGPE